MEKHKHNYQHQEIPDKIYHVIQQLSGLLGTAGEAVSEVCLLFQQGETSRGMRALTEVIDALQHIHNALEYLCSSGYAESLGLREAKSEIGEIFPAMLNSIEEQDFLALADVMEYELKPALASCRNRLPEKPFLPS